jgi:hypothetical protein
MFSKLLAMFLFISLPFLGFYLGMQYQKQTTVNMLVVSQVQSIVNPTPKSTISTNLPTDNLQIQPTTSAVLDPNLANKIIADISSSVNPNNNPTIEIKVLKIVGNFAWCDVKDQYGSGYAALAMNMNNHWSEIWHGQANFPCSIANQYNVPRILYGTCY